MSNDLSAHGALCALNEARIQVPKRMSVVGFDDVDITKYMVPPLSTVRNPISESGLISIQLLHDMIESRGDGMSVKLNGTYIERESVSVFYDSNVKKHHNS